MRQLILILGTLLICLSAAPGLAQIYKTVDKDGRVTYTDTPPPNTNAKPVELKTLNTTPAITPEPAYGSSVPEIGPEDYAVSLAAPENGKTLMPDERSVTMSVILNRPLSEGDLLAYKLDDQVISKTTELDYTLVEPPRGEHSISVAVINGNGEELAQSEAITIMVMRPLIKQLPPSVPKK